MRSRWVTMPSARVVGRPTHEHGACDVPRRHLRVAQGPVYPAAQRRGGDGRRENEDEVDVSQGAENVGDHRAVEGVALRERLDARADERRDRPGHETRDGRRVPARKAGRGCDHEDQDEQHEERRRHEEVLIWSSDDRLRDPLADEERRASSRGGRSAATTRAAATAEAMQRSTGGGSAWVRP